LVNWLVPAATMSLAGERGRPRIGASTATMEAGAGTGALLFVGAIGLTGGVHSFLDPPPAVGMMLGLGILKLYCYAFNRRAQGSAVPIGEMDPVFASPAIGDSPTGPPGAAATRNRASGRPLQTFRQLERVEWDPLMFFYGVVMCVGGLGALGYLGLAARVLYEGLGPTATNVLLGLVSALVDNVPVMFAVLAMNPTMPRGEWLLVTLTAGVG